MTSPWLKLFNVASEFYQPMNKFDRRFLGRLKTDNATSSNSEFQDEVDVMDRLGIKVELQNIFLGAGNVLEILNVIAKLILTKNAIRMF